MGCNYYAIPKATEKLKNEIILAVNLEDFTTVKRLIPIEVHIGKSSGGWQFCFNHNNWQYFEKSKESLVAFLLACDIFDEYDRPVSNEEFWNLVENKKGGQAHLTWNGSECGTMQFGLNFSNSTDFF
jgi:hypothetical protein